MQTKAYIIIPGKNLLENTLEMICIVGLKRKYPIHLLPKYIYMYIYTDIKLFLSAIFRH